MVSFRRYGSNHGHRIGTKAHHTLGFADQTEVRVDALPVSGEVPTWLRGGLVRVTPAQMDFERRSVSHWFDGMAMLNRFGFAGDGSVSYASRFLDTKARKAALASGGASIAGSPPTLPLALPARPVPLLPELTDNANVSTRAPRRRVHRDDRDADPGALRRRDAGDPRPRRGPSSSARSPPPTPTTTLSAASS